ncbi:hypothetical protein CKK33_17450 [Mucilaginibacter sp. MD40]|uniref:MauE/DoxX family redox-associated membrane protein n=1 Tax=Mucilaginibacter sp. MD40 TaxID=2029590 RepID=UPI000BAC9600|nr:MauE/DoxX family redox-associated membrane protein [Mucilaginibacter sp. MD40]PAW95188.1 hypothetical protein CKK33_17450 [Mucilaginibacter sp. MD40]
MEDVITNILKFQISELTKERIVIAIRWGCMALFFYTAYAKIIDHHRFLRGLMRVHLISTSAAFISIAVPIVEIIVSLLLLIPKTAKFGLCCFVTVMTGFTLYIISALIWEKNLPCNCGGAIEKLSWIQHIWFNVAFILIAICAIWLTNLRITSNLKQNEKF